MNFKKQIYNDLKKLRIKYKNKIFSIIKGFPSDPYEFYIYDKENKEFISYLYPVKDDINSFTFYIEGEGKFLLSIEYETINEQEKLKYKPKYKIERIIENDYINNKFKEDKQESKINKLNKLTDEVYETRTELKKPSLSFTIIAVILIVIFLFSVLGECNSLFNIYGQPEYIKDTVAYKEGDGIVIYFVLADKDGQETKADGKLNLIITENYYDLSKGLIERLLFVNNYKVKKEDFKYYKVGIGAFERTRLIYNIGRISYSIFYYYPKELTVTVYITFETNDGKVFKGSTFVIF